MGLRKPLGAFVLWPELAAVLGIRTRDAALPARVECPLCNGVLYVYEDTIKGGCWHYCAGCRRRGDAVELAASCWHCGVEEAVRVLRDRRALHLPAEAGDVAYYRHRHLDRRRQIDTFWDTCRERLRRDERSPTLNALRTRLGLHGPADNERWRDGPGLCLGASNRRAVEDLDCPGYAGQRRHPADRAAPGVLHGPNWNDILVVPYQDLPGRYSGYLFLGRQGGPEDRVYWRLRQQAGPAGREFGLAGLPLVWGQDGPVVAVSSGLLLAQLVVRNFRLSARQLPLVAWHDGNAGCTRTGWRSLEGRKVILWDINPEAKFWIQAVHTEAYVSLAGQRAEDKEQFLQKANPVDLLKEVYRHAVPWGSALSLTLERRGDGWGAGLWLELERAGVDVLAAAEALTTRGRAVLHRALVRNRARAELVIPWRHGQLRSHRKGLSAVVRGATIKVANFRVRIDTVLADQDPLVYRGRLQCERGTVPFQLNHAQITDPKAAALRQLVTRYQLGLLHIEPFWARQLVDIAMAFHEPSIERAGKAPTPHRRPDRHMQRFHDH